MPSDQTNVKTMLSKFWRLFLFAASAVYISAAVLIVAILHNPEWHQHLLRLAGRGWAVFVVQDVGSTGRGFLNGCLEAVFGIAAVAAMTGYLLGLKELQKHLMETAIIALFAFGTVTLIVYGTQFAWEVAKVGYEDHQTLASKASSLEAERPHLVDPASRDGDIQKLKKQLSEAQTQLEWRRDNISTSDPVFPNIIYLLQAFQIYRGEQRKPCVIYFTAMPDSLPLASAMAQFSNSVSGCFTFGPDVVGNPDIDDMAKDGMVPGVILVHILRGDKAALGLQERLGNQIQTRLSYKPPTIPRDHLYAGNEFKDHTESFIWLQFGTGVKWNSELFAQQRNK